jgi:hypothetical protein
VAAEQVDHLPLDVQVPAVDLVVTGVPPRRAGA